MAIDRYKQSAIS